ncbi:MAG: glycosyltransferase [Eggerthellaceae bacterium]
MDNSTDTISAKTTNDILESEPVIEPLDGAETPSPARPCVLVLHASVGSGHRSAAIAIGQAFEELRDSGVCIGTSQTPVPADLDVEVIDILDFGRIVFDGDKTASMFTGFTRPIYDLTWRFTLTGRLLWGGGTCWSRIMYPKFTDYVREKQPIAIVCTHIVGANVAAGARMLTGQNYPILSVPTDYETEGMWPHKQTDVFCVATEAMAETLRPRLIPERNILLTGIPTRKDFRQTYDRQEVRQKLGLPQDKKVILALAGAYLPRPYIHFRQALDQVLPCMHRFDDMHLVIISGNDGEYADHLRRTIDDLGVTNVTVLDYVNEMAALMAASDLAICKSGGLTVTECLCSQTPMILMGQAYGQEKANVLMLTSLGAAMHVTTARELIDALRNFSEKPEIMEALLINSTIVRRPNAAPDIAQEAFRLAALAKSETHTDRKKHFMRLYWGKKPAHTR